MLLRYRTVPAWTRKAGLSTSHLTVTKISPTFIPRLCNKGFGLSQAWQPRLAPTQEATVRLSVDEAVTGLMSLIGILEASPLKKQVPSRAVYLVGLGLV
jgi:hypothetical protein